MELPEITAKPAQRTRRIHNPEFKAQVLHECEQPGISTASVAQKHGLNANLIHKWRRSIEPAQAKPGFTPVTLPSLNLSAPSEQTVIFELNNIKVHWPISEIDRALLWLEVFLA